MQIKDDRQMANAHSDYCQCSTENTYNDNYSPIVSNW
jgi:hypothetical protein